MVRPRHVYHGLTIVHLPRYNRGSISTVVPWCRGQFWHGTLTLVNADRLPEAQENLSKSGSMTLIVCFLTPYKNAFQPKADHAPRQPYMTLALEACSC